MAAHRRLALAFLFALSLTAEDTRAVVRAGPFRVVSLAGLAPAQLEQFRYAVINGTGQSSHYGLLKVHAATSCANYP